MLLLLLLWMCSKELQELLTMVHVIITILYIIYFHEMKGDDGKLVKMIVARHCLLCSGS